jgi:uncharacterized protein (DUF952 family)
MLYHLALAADWDEAQLAGEYRVSSRGASLDEVGFIHASFAEQLPATAARYYADVEEGLLVLVLDPDRLGSEVVIEPAASGERFPHIYGPIPVDAVTEVRPARMVGGQLDVRQP